MRDEAQSWWRQAQHDLDVAEHNYRGGYSDAASWYCQQAVEKGLKALILDQADLAPPRTHNLRHLGHLLSVTDDVRVDLLQIDPLFEMTRYPYPDGGIPAERITATDALEHVAAAQRVLTWIDSKLAPSA